MRDSIIRLINQRLADAGSAERLSADCCPCGSPVFHADHLNAFYDRIIALLTQPGGSHA